MTTAAEQVTVIRAGLDPSNYLAGAEAIEVANSNLVQSGEQVAATDEKLRRGRASAQTSFERLRRELDENVRAQGRYEAAQRTVASAVERGRATQDEANRVLDLARARHEAVGRAAEARAQAEEAAARRSAASAAQASQQAFNQVLGVRQPTSGEDYAKRATDMAAFGAEMDRLRAKYDPLFAASKRYEAVLEEIADAERRGALSARLAQDARSRATAEFDKAVGPMRALDAANENTHGGMTKLTQGIGQAGFQLQDFAVQVAGGQSALVALGQQGSQLLGIFGPAGAAAGAALAVGVLIAQFVGGADASKVFKDALDQQEEAYKSTEDAAKRRRDGLAEEAEKVANLTTYYASLTAEQRRGELVVLEQRRAQLEQTGRVAAQGAGASIRDRASNNLYGFAPGDVIGDGGGAGAVPAAVARAAEALSKLDDASNRTREGIRGIIAELDEAAAGGGTFGRSIGVARDEVIKLAPELERNGEAVKQVRQQIEAAGGPLANLGQGARGAAGGVGELSGALGEAVRRVQDLRRVAADNPYADLERSVAILRAQSQALARGDNDAAEAIERREQARSKNAEQRARMLQEEEKNLRALGTSEADIAAARVTSEQRIGQLQGEVFRREEANREQEKKNREAEAEARRQASAARTAARREESEAARERRKELEAEADLARRLYEEPTRTPQGLLAISSADEAAMRRIQQLTKGGPLDPEHVRKQTDEAAKIQQRGYDQQQQAERTYDRIADYAGDRLADLFTGTENSWAKTMESLKKTAIATFARIAAEALLRPIIMPVVQAFSGSGGIAGALGSAASGSGATAASGLGGYAQQAGGFSDLLSVGSNPLTPTYSFSGGVVGRFDRFAGTNVGGFLDTPVYSQQAPAFGPFSAEAPTQAFTGNANSLTYGQAAAGGLSVVGGAFGIYQGIQTGGAKGFAQGVSGAAGVVGGAAGLAAGSAGALGIGAGAAGALATVAAVAPYVAAIAAVVAMLLPAQKPSNREGNYLVDTATGLGIADGQNGQKFSQENRDQAKALADQLVTVSRSIGAVTGLPNGVGGAIKIGYGDRDGAYYQNGVNRIGFSADEEGAKQLVARATMDFLTAARAQTPDDNVRRVIDATGVANIEGTLKNLEWYQNVYKEMSKTAEEAAATTNQFAIAMKALRAPYDEAIAKAQSLGLATTDLSAQQEEAAQKLIAQRDETYRGLLQGAADRTLVANGGNTVERQLQVFYQQQYAQQRAGAEQVRALGLGEAQVTELLNALIGAAEAEAQGLRMQDQANKRASWASLAERQARAEGFSDTEAGALMTYDRKAELERYAAQRDGVTNMVDLERTFALERWAIQRDFAERAVAAERQAAEEAAAIQRQAAEQAAAAQREAAERAAAAEREAAAAREARAGTAAGVVSTLADYARSLRMGDASPLNARAQYDLASREFQAVAGAAQAGDWNSITRLQGYSETLLSASRAVNGSGDRYVADANRIEAALSGIAELGANRLTASVMEQVTQTQTQVLEAAIIRLQNQVARLEGALVQAANRPPQAQNVAA